MTTLGVQFQPSEGVCVCMGPLEMELQLGWHAGVVRCGVVRCGAGGGGVGAVRAEFAAGVVAVLPFARVSHRG